MKIRCVYKIENKLNGRCYVGSTVNFTQRKWRHFYDMKKGRHISRFMQRDFNKCGAGAFTIEIIECVAVEVDLLTREQHWLDLVRPAYNSAKIAGSSIGIKHSSEVVQRNRERNAGFGNGNARISKEQSIEISGLLQAMTTEQIAQQFNVERSTVQRVCRRIGAKKTVKVYGESSRKMFSSNAILNIAGKNALPVYVLAANGGDVTAYQSITEAAKVLGIDVSAVAKRLKRKSQSFCRGFCISREPFDAAMVAWPYRSAA